MKLVAVILLTVLASAASAAPKEVVKLIDQLGAPSFKQRQAAEEELKKQPKSILPLLREYENSPDPEIRARVRRIIQRIAPTFKGFIGKRTVTLETVREFLHKVGIKYKNVQVRSGYFHLDLRDTGIRDLAPLEGMPITQFYYTPGSDIKGLDVIKNMPTLQTINGTQASIHWDRENNANETIDHYGLGELIRAAPAEALQRIQEAVKQVEILVPER